MRKVSTFHLGRQLSVAAVILATSLFAAGPANADDASDWLDRTLGSSTTVKASSGFSGSGSRSRSRSNSAPKSSSSRSSSSSSSRSSGGGNVTWLASSSCLNSSLRSVVHSIAASYGSVTVNSTCRSAGHNRRVGGAPKSHHLTGDAVDFRVHGNWGAAASRLRGHWGGFSHYGGGLFHIDSGPKRSW